MSALTHSLTTASPISFLRLKLAPVITVSVMYTVMVAITAANQPAPPVLLLEALTTALRPWRGLRVTPAATVTP
jgi:hypothetical protein